MSYTYDYPRPMVTSDVVVLRMKKEPEVLLIRRRNDPFRGSWALPGGYMEISETLEETARRELLEETAVRAGELIRFDTYDKPGRDPRGRTITQVFILLWNSSMGTPGAGSDASGLEWHSLNALPPLAFDHADILKDVIGTMQEGAK